MKRSTEEAAATTQLTEPFEPETPEISTEMTEEYNFTGKYTGFFCSNIFDVCEAIRRRRGRKKVTNQEREYKLKGT